ncbi:flagellin [Salipiger sp. P9]|uniref:flagellin n=1 Tax=Salipiger pentaromativorans TaxID=2943193 RepID=UPI0021579EAC|nr:flagellin [Salipiger pentaromativorans]MCR8550685.1 flagellin [Salipiger pentaromativorans]
MSSILTNEGASIALQTLHQISLNIAGTQQEIATGRRVSSAEDNAAVWAISQTMQADVQGYKRVSDSLSLGSATLAVARDASETVAELLTEIKGKIVSAQGENVDRSKIQSNVDALRDQIGAVVEMAQFNGLNLLKNSDTDTGSGSEAVLGFLRRDSLGVTGADIDIGKRDLTTNASAISASGGSYTAGAASATLDATQSGTLDASGVAVETGMGFTLSIFGTDADESRFVQDDLRTTTATAETRAEMATAELRYVARDGDGIGDVMTALARKWDDYAAKAGIDSSVLSVAASGTGLNVSSSVTDGTDTIAVNLNTVSADADNTIGGGLEILAGIDVSTATGATAALTSIEGLLDYTIAASAGFGSDQNRLETQQKFNDKLSDAMISGIGTLVDTDMEEATARLQALNVQQQLAVQALSIANTAPQSLLSLFR